MAPSAYPAVQPLSRRKLRKLLRYSQPADREWHTRKVALWAKVEQLAHEDPRLKPLELDIADVESSEYDALRSRLLVAVGTLCQKAGQQALWARIYDTVTECAQPGEELAFLDDTTDAVRTGEL